MKIAVVTGAARGIGKAVADLLTAKGVIVTRFDRKTDVRHAERVTRAIKGVLKRHGRIDILVNNAGVAVYNPVARLSETEWRKVIDTNLTGVFNMTKAVLPTMAKQRSGVIINISSQLGRMGYPGLSSYCASKFGVIGFTESLAHELRGTGVKTYTVLPGGVDTVMYHSLNKMEARRMKSRYNIREEKRRILKPEEITRSIVDLALRHRAKSGSKIEIFKSGRRMVKRIYR